MVKKNTNAKNCPFSSKTAILNHFVAPLINYLVVIKELAEAREVSLIASLEEADDLIIADTTRITLDYR